MLSPNGNWLKLSYMYSGVPITVPYEYYCDGLRVTGFNKYTLPDNVAGGSSGSLPSVITIRAYSNNTGYRIESEKFDTVLTDVSLGHDPITGLYLDGCYNFNNGTLNIDNSSGAHCPFTFEKNCLQNTTGSFRIVNNDYNDPIYFGDNCCTNMDLTVVSNSYVSRIGANSFRNIALGHELTIGNIDPNCCVNMTEPMYIGNNALVYCDLGPFVQAHKNRCDELGIKAIVFGNDCKVYNAETFKAYYWNYISFSPSAPITEVPRGTYQHITME